MAAPTVGSTSPPVQRAAASATATASASPSLTSTVPPPLAWILEISESGAEPARLPIQVSQLAVDRTDDLREMARRPDRHPDAGAERRTFGDTNGPRVDGDYPPGRADWQRGSCRGHQLSW